MSEVTTRLKEVQNRIEAARMRSPYHQDVTLVAVTKFHPVSEMKEVIAQGVTQVGENRVQEMEERGPARLGRCRMCCWNSIFPVRRPRQVSSRMPLKKRWKPLRHFRTSAYVD